MADNRLEKIRQLMAEEAAKKTGGNKPNSSFGDNASYPFWNAPEDSTATIRLLPDKDEENPWFWAEKQTIRLPFEGTINGDSPTDKRIEVNVPCVDMFKEHKDVCPIIAETKPWWKDDAKKELARLYYKKYTFIAQGFVVHSPFEEPAVPENPIRRFTLGKELIEKLRAGMADPDMEFLPTDYMNGYDFRIRKTKKGEYSNYGTSDWGRRSRPLTETETMAIETHGLFNLADFRGARPDADGVAAIKAMFHASLAGDPYDFAQFGKYYRPYGAGSFTAPTPSATADDVAQVDVPETKAEVKTESSVEKPKMSDVLTRLREKNTASRG
jgi:hypothetical protein